MKKSEMKLKNEKESVEKLKKELLLPDEKSQELQLDEKSHELQLNKKKQVMELLPLHDD